MPAFNEEQSVAVTIADVRRALPAFDLLVVDDGSTDATRHVASAAGATVISLPFNLGVGAAMRAGFRFARDRGYTQAVQIDADGQHDPSEVPRLLEQLEHADLVIGARFAGRGDYVVRGPRRWAMVVLSIVLSRITGQKLTDSTSGFKAMGPRALDLFARDYPAEYLGDTIEALVIASKAGCRVVQVPVVMRERSGGTPSHQPLRSAVYLGRASIALLIGLIRQAPDSSHLPKGAS
ncbi:MAG: glycosyl transferase family 2 [Microbacterium sp.]|nr:glycosyl transferase family 2 [Microbacterium sp.]MBA4346849.1 glycosyl transferase family 2 [Microbacterium sp.]